MAHFLDPIALRSARQAAGLTQRQLGQRVGVSGPDTISRWEGGGSDPQPRQLRRLAAEFEVPITSLLVSAADEERDFRRLRIEAGLTIAELASLVNVAEPTLKRWESKRVRRLKDRAPVDVLVGVLGVNAEVVLDALELSSAT